MRFHRWPCIDAYKEISRKRAAFHRSPRLARGRLPLFADLNRIELTGSTDGIIERLKADGLIQIIAWRLGLFVLTNANGPASLAALLERHPLRRVIDPAAV